MRPAISFLSRCSLLVVVSCLSALHVAQTPGGVHSSALAAVADRSVVRTEYASTHFMVEVRLRRLHLARPDLIPYPLETEVYC